MHSIRLQPLFWPFFAIIKFVLHSNNTTTKSIPVLVNTNPLEFVGYTWVRHLPDDVHEFVVCFLKGIGGIYNDYDELNSKYEIYLMFSDVEMYTVSYYIPNLKETEFKSKLDVINDSNLLESLKALKNWNGVSIKTERKIGAKIKTNYKRWISQTKESLQSIKSHVNSHDYEFKNRICVPKNGYSYFKINLSENTKTNEIVYKKITGFVNETINGNIEDSLSFYYIYEKDIYDMELIKSHLKEFSYDEMGNKLLWIGLPLIGLVIILMFVFWYIRRRKLTKNNKLRDKKHNKRKVK